MNARRSLSICDACLDGSTVEGRHYQPEYGGSGTDRVPLRHPCSPMWCLHSNISRPLQIRLRRIRANAFRPYPCTPESDLLWACLRSLGPRERSYHSIPWYVGPSRCLSDPFINRYGTPNDRTKQRPHAKVLGTLGDRAWVRALGYTVRTITGSEDVRHFVRPFDSGTASEFHRHNASAPLTGNFMSIVYRTTLGWRTAHTA